MKDAPAKESAIKTWDVDRPAVIETSWNSPSVEVVGHVSPFDHRRPTRHRKFGPMEGASRERVRVPLL